MTGLAPLRGWQNGGHAAQDVQLLQVGAVPLRATRWTLNPTSSSWSLSAQLSSRSLCDQRRSPSACWRVRSSRQDGMQQGATPWGKSMSRHALKAHSPTQQRREMEVALKSSSGQVRPVPFTLLFSVCVSLLTRPPSGLCAADHEKKRGCGSRSEQPVSCCGDGNRKPSCQVRAYQGGGPPSLSQRPRRARNASTGTATVDYGYRRINGGAGFLFKARRCRNATALLI